MFERVNEILYHETSAGIEALFLPIFNLENRRRRMVSFIHRVLSSRSRNFNFHRISGVDTEKRKLPASMGNRTPIIRPPTLSLVNTLTGTKQRTE
jgi:hypothetical protein